MAKIKLTDDQIYEVCNLYVEKLISPKEIGLLFNVSKSTILKYLKNNGIEIRGRRLKINPGDKFGRWTVIEETHKKGGDRRCFLCECSCEKKTRKVNQLGSLISGNTTSCGCYHLEIVRGEGGNEPVIGRVYGRLTIISEVKSDRYRNRRVMAQCSCDGNIKEYGLNKLRRGDTQSCGCYFKERIKMANTYQLNDYRKIHPFFCEVEEIRDRVDEPGIEVKCKKCGEWFRPGEYQLGHRIKAIENQMGCKENNFYCSDNCKNSCSLYRLKSDPFKARKVGDNTPSSYELTVWSNEVLKRQKQEYGYNFCVKCQKTEKLAAHHIDPKKIEPFYALDPENGVIFCMDCHGDGHKGICSTGALAYKICK